MDFHSQVSSSDLLGMSNDKLIDLRWPLGGLREVTAVVSVRFPRGLSVLIIGNWHGAASQQGQEPKNTLLAEAAPCQQGWGSLTAPLEELALAKKLHSGPGQTDRWTDGLFPARPSAPRQEEVC